MALLTPVMSCTIAERVVFFPWIERTGTRVVELLKNRSGKVPGGHADKGKRSRGTGAMRWLLGGWQFAPGIRAQSGWPIDVRTGTDTSATGEGNDRPNLVAGQPLCVYQWRPCNTTGTTQCYVMFNKAAFATFPRGTFGFGNVGRDFLRYPGTFNIDAVSRVFPIHEQKQIEFRFEAFNAMNHFNPSVGVPGSTAGLNSSNFGRQSGANVPGFVPSPFDPRILQFGFKLHW